PAPDPPPAPQPRRRERDCDGGEQKTPSAASVALRPCWPLASAKEIVELVELDQVAGGFRHDLPFAGAGAGPRAVGRKPASRREFASFRRASWSCDLTAPVEMSSALAVSASLRPR